MPVSCTVFDLEGDSLDPTKIWVVSAQDEPTEGFNISSYTTYPEMKEAIEKPSVLVGHNIARFDIPVLKKLLGVKTDAWIIDTLAISWYLYPERLKHGLDDWGEELGYPKPPIDDWENLELEEYVHRCQEDVKINTTLWRKMQKDLMQLYGDEKHMIKFLRYLSFKMDCAARQEESRWKFDRQKALEVKSRLEARKEECEVALNAVMPTVKKYKDKAKPPKCYKKNGDLSVAGEAWFALLKEKGKPKNFNGYISVLHKEEKPNCNSGVQVKDWLFSLGWEPQTFKFVKNDKGERSIPQVRFDNAGVKELCPSVIKLKEKEPAIEYLEDITVVTHRLGLVNGMLEAEKDGYVAARIAGLTNTLRFKHKELVNLPGVDKPWGKDIRGLLIAPEGYELCGSDMCSLEDMTKRHYMYNYDPDYVEEMSKPGYEPHLDIAIQSGMLTFQQVEDHKNGVKSYGVERKKAKVTNYAATYGAGPPAIARQADITIAEAKVLHTAYWTRNWAIKQIAEDCIVKTINGQMWLYNPVSTFWYSLRNDKDKFSTLNQSTGVFCFDKWLYYVSTKRKQLTGQFHDEGAWTIKKGFRNKCENLLRWAIDEVNKKLKLNVKLDIDVQFGDNYAEIH